MRNDFSEKPYEDPETSVSTHSGPEPVQLARSLNTRVSNFLTLGSAVGTGLIIGSGTALQRGGPISLFIAYIFTGSLLSIVIYSIGEIAAFSPMDKSFSGYVAKYVDPAFGFAAGWNYFLKYAVVLSANLTAFGLVIQFWRHDLNVGIWVTVLYVVVIACNFLAVRVYGEIEFWLTLAKMTLLVLIFLVCLVITCGGAPDHKTIGFQFWRESGTLPFLVPGNTGKFLGWWACVVQSVFGFMGSEMVVVVANEMKDPRKTIPGAARLVIIRIICFYIFGVFILGLAVLPLNPALGTGGTNANGSPFVIAIKTSGIKVLPSFINACLLLFIGSSANTDIYICSRQLYGLAKDGLAPSFFMKLNRRKVPYWGCIFGSLLGLLAYMNTKESAATVFGYISSTVTVFGILNWIYILLAYIGYTRALRAQNVPREEIPFRMWGQPYIAYVALFFVLLITFFNGYNAFITSFQYKTFITSYIGIFANAVLIVGYKVYHRTSFVKPAEIDFGRGEAY